MLDAAMIAGVTGGNQGPSSESASPPTQMLLRHGGNFRRTDVIDVSGVLSEEESKTLSDARDSAASRAQAFADMAAGWAANRTATESVGFTFTGDGDEADKGIFVDPGLA